MQCGIISLILDTAVTLKLVRAQLGVMFSQEWETISFIKTKKVVCIIFTKIAGYNSIAQLEDNVEDISEISHDIQPSQFGIRPEAILRTVCCCVQTQFSSIL